MNKTCACTGIRTCLNCGHDSLTQNGINPSNIGWKTYHFCARCKKAWSEPVKVHRFAATTCEHEGQSIDFPGIDVIEDFVTSEEEQSIVDAIDRVPWVESQSGRRKQDYGPKANFKKRKVKSTVFTGLPAFSETLIKRFERIPLLRDFETVELCNLDYNSARGASIDAHKDDEWLWGERLVTLNLLGATHYTMTYAPAVTQKCVTSSKNGDKSVPCDKKKASNSFYKDDKSNRKQKNELVVEDSAEKGVQIISGLILNSSENGGKISSKVLHPDSSLSCQDISTEPVNTEEVVDKTNIRVQIFFPPRALIIMYGAARFDWKHSILREHIQGRRMGITMRELTPLFRPGGDLEHVGHEVLEKAKSFTGISVAEFELQRKNET